MSPQRIQRRRVKGWRMPDGALYVGRPTIWGNPWDTRDYGRDLAITLFKNTACGIWSPSAIPDHWNDAQVNRVYAAHRNWLKRLGGHPLELAPSELKGHDLACWCPLDQPCHADVLLKIANRR